MTDENQFFEKADVNASAFFDLTNRDDAPLFEWEISAYRSLPVSGFVWLIALTCFLFLIPLLAFIGTAILWAILLPIILAVAALWAAFQYNYKDGTLCENVRIWPDLMTVERKNPREPDQYWHANPHWVKVHLRQRKEIENYLTLSGGNREIELASFQTPEERLKLDREIRLALRRVSK